MTSARLRRLKSRRQIWLRVHLYLGLFVGAVLAVVGFTGGILVFYEELQDVLNAEQIRIQAPPASQRQLCPLDDIIAAAETIKPPGSRFDKLYYPRHADAGGKNARQNRPPPLLAIFAHPLEKVKISNT
ncbi:hypothetical protein CWO84_07390 [Methylomonas sp. Kb3]|uniref:PepSY-associated TM helix domain-containing protein n=1 Tax=Methylomonas sp. Kb3 TaxID=1611544 RepID=UPI000C3314C7|nr:PepSY-associated TM helix domain-containing protein [Methylomonas sp. Kb3]PKD40701.1 hypothetical protein CWO84_07390 [Methylomonas sp. Kb3]